MSKEMVGCILAVVGKNKFLFKFKFGQMKDIISSSLVSLCSKEDVDMD